MNVARVPAALGVTITVVLVLLFVGFFAPISAAQELADWLSGEPSGEGLSALHFIQLGRDDMWGEFVFAVAILTLGLFEWAFLLTKFAERFA